MSSKINFLTPEEKKVLRSFSRYAQASGLDEVLIRLDLYGDDLADVKLPNHFDNAWNVKFQEPIYNILNELKQKVASADLIEYPDIDGELNTENVEIRIDVEDYMIEFIFEYSYYQTSEGQGTSWDEVEDKDEIEDILKLLKEEYPNEDSLTLSYYGSGDSGYLEDNFEGQSDVPSSVQDWCYNKLESNHGGWEINEGSQGSFVFDLEDGVISLNHYENYESTESDTFFTESFAK